MSRHSKTLTRSFAGGEMSPEMFGRMDDVKFQAGAATLLNMVPRPIGAAARRSGTRLVREISDSTKAAHLFPFVFSQTQSYVIEASRATVDSLEGGYFRFHQNGGTMLYSQPDRFVAGQIIRPYPCRQMTGCTGSGAMTITLVSHGLINGDQVQFVGGVVPGGLSSYTPYFVITAIADTFQIAATKGGGALSSTDQGYKPVLHCWRAWGSRASSLYWQCTDHGLKPGDAVVLSMEPYQGGGAGVPYVDFYTYGFKPISGYNSVSSSHFGQQVMFVPDAGATMPPNIVANKLYWTTSLSTSDKSIRISESFGGPSIKIESGATGKIRVASMPLRKYGDAAYIGCNEVYYVTNLSATKTWSGVFDNVVKLASSKDEAARGGGFVFGSGAGSYGSGNRRIHRVYEPGDIVNYTDSSGPRNFVCKKSNWRSPIEADSQLVTLLRHDEANGRVPGVRSARRQASYWRELPGRSTGPVIPVSTTAAGAGGDLVVTSSLHGFSAGQAISFVRGRPPSTTAIGSIYYVQEPINPTNFKISTDPAGTSLVATPAAGTAPPGDMGMQAWVTFVEATDRIGWPGHGLSNGDTVVFSASSEKERDNGRGAYISTGVYVESVAQGGLDFDKVFYVRDKTDNDFQVSATSSGPVVDLTGTDGAWVVASGNTIYELPHDYSEDELAKISTTQSNDVMTLASRDHPVAELRRLSATQWELADVTFKAGAPVPGPLYESEIVEGEYVTIQSLGYDTGSITNWGKANLVLGDDIIFRHNFSQGDPVYVSGLDPYLADGFYFIAAPTNEANPRNSRLIFLEEAESGDRVDSWGTPYNITVSASQLAASNPNARVRYGSLGADITQTYVVTAIDSNNEESLQTDPLVVSNNLLVSGASNTIGWGVSSSAVRYRIYKQLSGLYGLIGETDELIFKDDNIGPDLAVAPPIADPALREESRVTFDIDGDTVLWSDHGLSVGTAVVFHTSDALPTGIYDGKTYYVANASTDSFQITENLETHAIVDFTGTEEGEHVAVSGHFPSAVTYFEGRRIFGGSRALPQDIWMTASGTEADLSYSIPTVDSDRIYFRIASREGSAIRHLLPLSQLVLLSDTTEYRLSPANDAFLTPSSISVRPQSFVGADYPHPALVNNTVVFAAARGGHVRELGYNQDVLGYLTGDLSIRSAHLFDGYTIKDQAYSKAPLPIVWCVSSSGKLLGLTYIPEESVGAWHQHTTPDGEFESVASVPEGDEDAVYVVVKRGNKRYVERFADQYRGDTSTLSDAYLVDFGVSYSGASTTTVTNLDHLEGKAVSYLADGVAGTGTVTSGTLTLTKAASTVQVGLAYTSQIQTLPMTMMNVDAFGTGRTKNVNKVWVRTFESGAFKTGPSASNLRSSLSPSSGAIATGLVQVTLPASWDDDGQIVIQQEDPLPLTVVGLTIEVASGG